jgi:hypothetical protein
MALKKQKTPKRWRSKEAQDIAEAVEAAGALSNEQRRAI